MSIFTSDCETIKEILIKEFDASDEKAEDVLKKIINETGWRDDR